MPPFERLILLGIRDFGGKEALVQLHHPEHLILGIPFTHGIPEFMKHRPDWHIVLVAELALEFGGGEALLRQSQQVHGDEPVPQWQLAPVHHGVRLQTLAIAAVLALEAPLVALPVILLTTAVRADDTLCLTVLFQLALAGFLVGILSLVKSIRFILYRRLTVRR